LFNFIAAVCILLYKFRNKADRSSTQQTSDTSFVTTAERSSPSQVSDILSYSHRTATKTPIASYLTVRRLLA